MITINYTNKKIRKPVENLLAFSQSLSELQYNEDFLNAFSEDTGYSKFNIKQREIISSDKFIRLKLDQQEKDNAINKGEGSQNKEMEKVFCLLPGNAPLYAFCAKVLVPCILNDVDLSISFPSRLRKSKKYLKELFNTYLPQINIVESTNKGELFSQVINDSDIDTIIVFASDEWIGRYTDDIIKNNKRLIFEGPGNDPCVVFEEYSKSSVKDIARACLNNSGQSCSSIKRVYVKDGIFEDFLSALKYEVDTILYENPNSNNVIKSPAVFDKIEKQVSDALQKGATILHGSGKIVEDSFEPTIMEVPNNTSIVLEENFYPVVPIVKFSDQEQLEEYVFESNYGLNCSLFGNIPGDFLKTMQKNHKSTFINSTVVSPENYSEIMKLGGFHRSGFIMENGNKRQDAFYLEELIYS